MKLAIHQPEFFPWQGFFHKMAIADLYVVFDHVQFKKRYFENRNKIVSPGGDVSYIGVPVRTKDRYMQAIMDVEIDNSHNWQKKLLQKVQHFYSKAPFFERYFGDLRVLFTERRYDKLIDLNRSIIDFFRSHLGIFTPLVFSSDMNIEQFKASELILKLCLLNKADVYLCGVSGKDYLKVDDFVNNNVRIEWLHYEPRSYTQMCNNFVPYMSTLDLLLNYGDKSLEFMLGQDN